MHAIQPEQLLLGQQQEAHAWDIHEGARMGSINLPCDGMSGASKLPVYVPGSVSCSQRSRTVTCSSYQPMYEKSSVMLWVSDPCRVLRMHAAISAWTDRIEQHGGVGAAVVHAAAPQLAGAKELAALPLLQHIARRRTNVLVDADAAMRECAPAQHASQAFQS